MVRAYGQLIREETGLTASAGIATIKLIAKIASDWNKPGGQFTVPPSKAADFMKDLPVKKIPGVGGKMAEKLAALGVETCGQYRVVDKFEWVRRIGGYGAELWERCWGLDDRPVTPDSPRKSLSIENTFAENLPDLASLEREMNTVLDELQEDLATRHSDRHVRGLAVKLTFSDFRRTTAERAHPEIDRQISKTLLLEAESRSEGKPTRLLGVGVRFHDLPGTEQMELFV
jgi:DNA polymerase-4